MRMMLATVLIGGLGLSGPAAARAQAPPPPLPAPAPPSPVPASPPSPADSESASSKPPSPIQVSPQEKRECVLPGKHGDGLSEGGKIKVENPEPNELKATLTGVAAAHCFVGCHSSALQTFQLVQEFDLTSTDPNITQASVSLECSLNGYVRSVNKGSACLRLARATVTAPSWPTSPLSTSFAPACASGPCGQALYQQEYKSPEEPLLPLGRYVLVADMVIEASSDGLVNGHGVADFSSDDLPDGWKQEHDPFKDQDRKDFGFSITVKATAPNAKQAASARKHARRGNRVVRVKSEHTEAAQP